MSVRRNGRRASRTSAFRDATRITAHMSKLMRSSICSNSKPILRVNITDLLSEFFRKLRDNALGQNIRENQNMIASSVKRGNIGFEFEQILLLISLLMW